MNKLITPFLALTAASMLVAGCASTGYDKASCTSMSLQKTAANIDKGTVQLDDVLASLSDLENNPGADLKPQFKTFSTALSKLESLSDEVNSQTVAMQKEGADYFQKWDEQDAKILNENIRTRSADRKAVVTAKFDKVKASYLQTKSDFAPVMSDLKDIRTALATDLTVGGLASIKGTVSKANRDGKPLRESLVSLAADFKALGVSISATTPAK